MQRIKQELENLSLMYLDPYGYTEVKQDIEKKYGTHTDFVEHIRKQVGDKMRENNISFTLEGRIKSVYSIYKKMYTQNKSFDEIYDFYALRLIVDTELACYTALGIIHEMYKSMPGRFKDYISTPKPNLYRSLHTTVIGRFGVPFEVQIRTREMHEIAEFGIAAHWKYKSGAQSRADIDKKLAWVSRLLESEEETRDPDEFIDVFKTDVFQDETFVFTPKGDVITLSKGATVIDFAYAIHSAVGNKMTGAKINGMIVPIDRVPQNGEIVEIITSGSSKGPSRDWLNIVKTGQARSKIRQWFKKEKRADNIVVGKAAVEMELKKFGRPTNEAQRQEIIAATAQRVGYASADDLFNTIGYGGITVSKISTRLREEFDKVVRPEPQQEERAPLTVENIRVSEKPRQLRHNSGIVVDGERGCQVKFAKCCNPLPGDNVIGFITKGFGISIHKVDCPNVEGGMKKPEDADRWVEAHWERGSQENASDVYEALVQIYAYSSLTILAEITMALADMKVLLLQINTQKKNDGRLVVNLKISCKNVDHYHSIVSRLKSLKDVIDIGRGFS
ncbi:MAG: bifunctional (p)ppGpp synthetase/guanosine-3',5'-bis(diphosphate) 3'-pyrophosphohydrolase, partial [Clostridia bacterium]|nr:bifunctional (p)ppGpp synthetase/guanosine-3',5'-bis(diphosphate) 3'-pyrophosphohydrolase [Clostridia bacterium]